MSDYLTQPVLPEEHAQALIDYLSWYVSNQEAFKRRQAQLSNAATHVAMKLRIDELESAIGKDEAYLTTRLAHLKEKLAEIEELLND